MWVIFANSWKRFSSMDVEEFNKFLKTVKLTSYGHPITNRWFFECDNGWLKLIHDLIVELLDNGWNGEVQQVKEKFGDFRFYADHTAPYNIIVKYERLINATCEKCGEPGDLCKSGSWLKTLCNKHATENNYEILPNK